MGYGCYDIVAANILAEVLTALTPVVTAQMKPGAVYILSGIIDDKEETVKDAVKKAGLELLDVNHQGRMGRHYGKKTARLRSAGRA